MILIYSQGLESAKLALISQLPFSLYIKGILNTWNESEFSILSGKYLVNHDVIIQPPFVTFFLLNC
jgi:hypothetical protein